MRAAFFVCPATRSSSYEYRLINRRRSAEDGSMSAWLTDIRKTALVAAISALGPLAYPVGALPAILGRGPWFIDLPFALLFVLFIAIYIGFLVVLYRSDVPLRISKQLRYLALAAAAASSAYLLWHPIRGLQLYWAQIQHPNAVSGVRALDLLGAVADTLFLIAIFRHADESSASDTRHSGLLRRMATISVVFWSLGLIGIVAGAIYSMVEYPYFQGLARYYGREEFLPSLTSDLLGRARAFYLVAQLWVPPFIIYRSLRAKREVAEIPPESVSPEY